MAACKAGCRLTARPWGSAGAGGPALGPRDGKGPAGGRCGGNEGYSGMRESSRSEAPAGCHPAGIFGGSIPGQSKALLGPPPAEHPWWLLTRWHQTPALRRGRWVRAPCPWGPQGERGVLCGELEKGGWGARGKAPHRPELLRNRDKGWATRHRLSPACFVHPDKEGAWPHSNPEPRRKGAAGLPPAILGKNKAGRGEMAAAACSRLSTARHRPFPRGAVRGVLGRAPWDLSLRRRVGGQGVPHCIHLVFRLPWSGSFQGGCNRSRF